MLTELKSTNDEKEPSLEARGAGSRLYGGRYKKVIPDDIQSDNNLSATPQLMRYIRQTVLTRPQKGVGSTIFFGSRVGAGDVYEAMIDEGMVDRLVTIPALTSWVDRRDHFWVDAEGKVQLVPDCPEVSQWPGYWSMLDLAKRRKLVGEEVWQRTYMQRSWVEAGGAFTQEMLQAAKDLDRGLGRNGMGLDVICTVDPALDTGVCAFICLAYASDRLWVIDLLERRDISRYEDIYHQVNAWCAQYRPSVWVVEQNNFQKGLHQDDRMKALEQKYRFRTVPHQTSRNKNDPVMGVAAMASAFADQEIRLPWGDEESIKQSQLLLDELRLWRPKTKAVRQDLVMALWFGWLYWEQERRLLASRMGPKRPLRRPSWIRRAS